MANCSYSKENIKKNIFKAWCPIYAENYRQMHEVGCFASKKAVARNRELMLK